MLKDPFTYGHRNGHDLRRRGLQSGSVYFAPIDLLEQARNIRRNQINDVQFQRLFGRDDGAFAHGGFGPLDIAMPFGGDPLHQADSIVLIFLDDWIVALLWLRPARADLDEMSGADAGMRSHRRDVRGQRNETAGAGGIGSRRSYKNDNGDRGGIKRLNNFLGGGHQAARRVELNDQAGVFSFGRNFDRAADVTAGGRADGAVDLD